MAVVTSAALVAVERAIPVEPVMVAPEAMIAVVAALSVMLVPAVIAAMVVPAGMLAWVTGMPIYQPAVLPV